MKYFLFIGVIAICLLAACRLSKSNKSDKQVESIRLFKVEKQPTPPENQEQVSRYINEYKVMEEIILSATDKTSLISELKAITMYPPIDIKRCPFLGKYAIIQNGENYTELIFSTSPCNKIYVSENSKKPVLLQLKDEAAIFDKIEFVASK